MKFVNVSAIKKRARGHGRRVGKEFLLALDDWIATKIDAACQVHNGGKVTLDSTIASYVGIVVRKEQ